MLRGQGVIELAVEIMLAILILILFFGILIPGLCHAIVAAGYRCILG